MRIYVRAAHFMVLAGLVIPSLAQADSAFCAAPAAGSWPASPPVGDVVLSEFNMRAAQECSGLAPTDHKGRSYGFVGTTREMVRQGRACLRKQGALELLASLDAILKPGGTPGPVLLVCGDNRSGAKVDVHGVPYPVSEVASALTPGMSGYAGVIFNLNWINSSPVANFKAGFFHELFHTAGFDHAHGVDYAYFAAGCCFESNEAACDLLRRSVGKGSDWWTSADYLVDAIKWFYGRDGVASNLLNAAAAASGKDQRGVLAGLLQYGKNRTGEGNLDAAASKDLTARCLAAGGAAVVCKTSFPVNKH